MIQTGRGRLEIADRKSELKSWTIPELMNWLLRNDPNGEWGLYFDDYEHYVDEWGEPDAADLRSEVWDQMQDA
jgi:hypothetical protein